MRDQLSAVAEVLFAAEDHDSEVRTDNGGSAALKAGMDLHRMARAMIKERRSHPGDDIFSALVHADFDEEALSDQILRNIFSLFLTAGKRHNEEYDDPRIQTVLRQSRSVVTPCQQPRCPRVRR